MSKNTAIYTRSPAPAIKYLFDGVSGINILDFGAGRYSRNAEYLRAYDNKVYAYDPYHGKLSADPFTGEIPSVILPTKCCSILDFDTVFTCFVLNTIDDEREIDSVIRRCEGLSSNVFHITRNLDLLKLGTQEEVERGVYTKKGFQRLVNLHYWGYDKKYTTRDYIIWTRYK